MPSVRLSLILIIGLWLVMTVASLAWNILDQRRHVEQLALENGRVIFSLLETARLWNAKHGGVYAPVTEETQPNPYLQTERRDLQIGDLRLTLINPAYMTRQISELAAKENGVLFHITSLRPIRPENAPDPWEAKSLATFENGVKEAFEMIAPQTGEGAGYNGAIYRYMAPLPVRQPCLACHAAQGYKLGDVRGGISVTVPAKMFLDANDTRINALAFTHVFAFLLLSGLTAFFVLRLDARNRELDAVRRNQETLIEARTKELERQKHDLQLANAELETFSYGASHDLQEPLRMVSGYLSLIRHRYKDGLDAEGQEFIAFAEDGAVRMKGIIESLLDYSRVNRMGQKIRAVDSGTAITAALDTARLKIDQIGAGVTVQGDLPVVMADPDQLTRVFVNLIGNAVKYRRRDGTTLAISVGWSRLDDFAGFFVRDNGCGVPDDKKEDIFLIFHRDDHIGDEESRGTGIGLALCRKIIDRFGGRIWVEDNDTGKEGATFRFTVPLAKGDHHARHH